MRFRTIAAIAALAIVAARPATAASETSITTGGHVTAMIGQFHGRAPNGHQMLFTLVSGDGLTIESDARGDNLQFAQLLVCDTTCELHTLVVSMIFYNFEFNRDTAFLKATDPELGEVDLQVRYHSLRNSTGTLDFSAAQLCPSGGTRWSASLDGAVQADPALGKGGIRAAHVYGQVGAYQAAGDAPGEPEAVFARYTFVTSLLSWENGAC